MSLDHYRLAFLEAARGITGHHIIAVMNVATPGINWGRCSKAHIADSYARTMSGRRISLSWEADSAMRALNLELLRRAALERSQGNLNWASFYHPLPVNHVDSGSEPVGEGGNPGIVSDGVKQELETPHRNVLEQAALAMGKPERWRGDGIYIREQFCEVPWNPLESDEQAHQLQVKLKMTVAWDAERSWWSVGAVVNGQFDWLAFDGDCNHAITYAAATIGQSLS